MAQRPGVDIVIIGGDVMGCAIAYEAARAGAKVRLIEPGVVDPFGDVPDPGLVEAQITTEGAGPLHDLKLMGREKLPAWAAAVAEASGVKIGVEARGALWPVFDMAALQSIHQRAAQQRAAGLSFKALTAGDARDLEPGLPEETVAALSLPDELLVDARALRRALATAAAEAGAEIYAGTPILGLIDGPKGSIAGVKIPEGPLEAAITILCADIGPDRRALPIERRRQPVVALSQGRWPRRVLWSEQGFMAPGHGGGVLVSRAPRGISGDPRVTVEELGELMAAARGLMPSVEELAFVGAGVIGRDFAPDGLPVVGPDEAISLIQARAFGADALILAPVIAPLIIEYLQTGRTGAVDWSPLSPLRLRG